MIAVLIFTVTTNIYAGNFFGSVLNEITRQVGIDNDAYTIRVKGREGFASGAEEYQYFNKNGGKIASRKILDNDHLSSPTLFVARPSRSSGGAPQVGDVEAKIPDGRVIEFYNGQQSVPDLSAGQASIKFELFYKNNKREGKYTKFYPSGKVSAVSYYVDDLLNGPFNNYHESGVTASIGTFVGGNIDGELKGFNPSGNIQASTFFDNGSQLYLYMYGEDGKITQADLILGHSQPLYSVKVNEANKNKIGLEDLKEAYKQQQLEEQQLAEKIQKEDDQRRAKLLESIKSDMKKRIDQYRGSSRWEELQTVIGEGSLHEQQFNKHFLYVNAFKNVEDGSLTIIYALDEDATIPMTGKFLIRLADANGVPLTFFYTQEFYQSGIYPKSSSAPYMSGIRSNAGRSIPEDQLIREITYQVSIRDLRDSKMLEIGFNLQY